MEAGNLPKGTKLVSKKDDLYLDVPGKGKVDLQKQLAAVEPLSEEEKRKKLATLGWAVFFWPALLIGGGKKKKASFMMTLKDGNKLLSTTDVKTFTQLRAIEKLNS
jgi:hypothetical protein